MAQKEGVAQVVLATCSGASNTGAVTAAAGDLVVAGVAGSHLICLPALALGRDKPIKRIQEAQAVVVIDGCAVRCASAIVRERTGREPDLSVEVVQDFAVEKKKDRDFDPEFARRVADRVLGGLSG
jgi:uncharacterized metal-binding protein